MIKYCSECGTKHEYKFSPPKFCSNCGSPMGVAQSEAKPLNRNVETLRKSKALIGSLGGKSPPKKRETNIKRLEDIL